VVVLAAPDFGPASTGPPAVAAYHARLVALLGENRSDPSALGSGFLPDSRVLLLEGPLTGQQVEAYLQAPGGGQGLPAYAVGDDVLVTITDAPSGPPFIAISDRWRLAELAIIFVLFIAAVVLVGGWQGVRALLGLALTAAIVVRILVPELLQGVPPVPLAVGLAIVLTIAIIGLTEGLSRPGVAAILGTTGALCLTALMSATAVAFAGFTNAGDSDLIYLQTAGGAGLDLRGLLLAAFVIGSLGVLNDVTVTQAVAVGQLHDEAGLQGRDLFASAFRVGRSHIGATINTLFLAYAGASLPLIVLFSVSQQPAGLIVNSEGIAVELVRTFVGSIGLVAAVPLSTGFATWLAGARIDDATFRARPQDATSRADRLAARPLAALVAGLAGIAALTTVLGIALGPAIMSPPRAPETAAEEVFPSPGASLPAFVGSPVAGGQPSAGPEASAPTGSLVPSFQVHDVIDLAVLGGQPATIEVTAVHITSTATARRVEAELQFTSTTSLLVDPSTWTLLTDLGNEYAATTKGARAPALSAGTVGAGHNVKGWLTFVPLPADTHGFLELVGPDGAAILAVELY
jgi:uncharacterized membrane protein